MMTKTPTAACTADAYFDLNAALDRCCDDENFLAEMIDLLGSSVPAQRDALAEAIRDRDPQALSATAHALKGTVASMTTSVPYQILRELEFIGRDGHCTGAEVLFAALLISLDQLLRETRTWADRQSRTCSS